jgi:hypothetical protein
LDEAGSALSEAAEVAPRGRLPPAIGGAKADDAAPPPPGPRFSFRCDETSRDAAVDASGPEEPDGPLRDDAKKEEEDIDAAADRSASPLSAVHRTPPPLACRVS